jgi:hypothetical protein
MLKEFDCGDWLSFDHVKLSPVTSAAVSLVDPPTLAAAPLGGNIMLFWPTNASGFLLEAATNLSSLSWNPVMPSPVTIGTNQYVTNAVDAAQKFFRLRKP